MNKQCLNNAKTVKNILSNEELCFCGPKHNGALCEKPLCLNYCYNDGKCSLELNSTDGQSMLKCECSSSRFYGHKCQFDSCSQRDECPVNCYLDSTCNCKCGFECDRIYCNRNNGTCIDANGSVGCKFDSALYFYFKIYLFLVFIIKIRCRPGYSGPTCRINDCKGRCFNDGECIRTENKYYCRSFSIFF
jgi:hypothetical protein